MIAHNPLHGSGREPQLLILLYCLTYPPERTGRVAPALNPGCVLLSQVPFGQPSSLHPLRRRLPGIVRGLRGRPHPLLSERRLQWLFPYRWLQLGLKERCE
jgi:hypothetical protein